MEFDIVGRESELKHLKTLFEANESHFLVVYGRRRVGKTFLVRETFKKELTFYFTGLSNASTAFQLKNFNAALGNSYKSKTTVPQAKDWFSAFQQLVAFLEKSRARKKVIFIDEMPWLDTPKSNFLSALEHFWNSWASARKDILLITCGSAASWMVNKLINNNGGLHNRVTSKMKILPFTLKETELFFANKQAKYSRYQLVEAYMTTGGIPFYLSNFKLELSIAQNIDRLFFEETGLLHNEINNLYRSLFKNATPHEEIVKALSTKSMGLTRDEIIKITKLSNGGGTSKALSELIESGFIRKYTPFGKMNRESIYQLLDFYTLIYYKFLYLKSISQKNYWLTLQNSPQYHAWSGYAFELVCLVHLNAIKEALGIAGINCEVYSWRSKNSEKGVQIDLVIDRKDGVINLCEMKFSKSAFEITANYEQELIKKMEVFAQETNTKKALFLTLIATYDLTKASKTKGLVQRAITLDDIFS